MKYLPIFWMLFFAVNSDAQQVEIINLSGQHLDSLRVLNNRDIIDYTDPANNLEFVAKNKCKKCSADTSITFCSKISGNLTYRIFFSDNLAKVLQLKTDTVPSENEIILFYQTFESRIYDFSKEERPDRYIGISLPEKLKKAIRKKKFDALDIVKIYEHDFFDPSKFSGTSLYFKIEEEIGN
jgi:hypothetical protein